LKYNAIVASIYLLPYVVSPRVLIPSSNLASAFEGGDRQGEETIFFCALSLHNTVQAGAVRLTPNSFLFNLVWSHIINNTFLCLT